MFICVLTSRIKHNPLIFKTIKFIFPFEKCLTFIGIAIIFLGCKSIPEGPSGPFLAAGFDTVVQFKNFIIPGDTLIVTLGFASQSNVNQIHAKVNRSPFSERLEFYGPDSDWVFSSSKQIPEKLNGKNLWKFVVPTNIRPGISKWKLWLADSENRSSDTSKFEFPVNVLYYPLIVVNLPSNPNVATKLINKDTLYPDSAQFKILAYTNLLEHFSVQWWDSAKTNSFSEPVILPLKGTTSPFSLDTILKAPDAPKKYFQLKMTLKTTDNRREEYWVPFFRK